MERVSAASCRAGSPPWRSTAGPGDNGDPDNFLHVLLGCTAARPGGNNIARWCDADYDALVTKAKLTCRPPSSARLYPPGAGDLPRPGALDADRPFRRVHGDARDVTGFRIDPLGRHPFDGVDIKD